MSNNSRLSRIVSDIRAEARKALGDEMQPIDIEALLAVLKADILRNIEINGMPTQFSMSQPLCQLKISLDGIRPQIRRRIVVPHAIPLPALHDIFQIALGWTDSHLHSFKANDVEYQIDCGEFEYDQNYEDEDSATLDMLVSKSKDRFDYTYDFGDNWQHTVVVERMLPYWSAQNTPICLDGANSVPPEDCGSTPGYLDLRRILKNPKHSEYADMRRWAGRKFDPQAFDLEKVNKRLAAYGKKGRLTPSMIPDIRMS